MDILQILSLTAGQILAPATLGYVLAAIGLSVHFGFAGLLNMGVAGFMAIGAYGFAISILTFGIPWPIAALIPSALGSSTTTPKPSDASSRATVRPATVAPRTTTSCAMCPQ